MKPLVVQDQVKLSAARCFKLCIAGMSYRLFRSLVTVSILALAVTFLSHVWSHSLLVHATQRLAWERLRETRVLGEWALRLTEPDDEQVIREALVEADPDRLAEYRQWSGADERTIQQMQQTATAYADALAFIESLPAASRAVLTGGRDPAETLAVLTTEQSFDRFGENMEALRIAPPEGGLAGMRSLMAADYPALQTWVQRVQRGQREAIAAVRSTANGRSARDWFASQPDDVQAVLAEAGFRIDAAQVSTILGSAEQDALRRKFDASLERERLKIALSRKMNVRRREVTPGAVLAWASSASNARWLAEQFADSDSASAEALTVDRIQSLSASAGRVSRLESAAGSEEPGGEVGLFSLPRAMRWLVLLSFLVCAIGVTNAMFMSVTERFTEIATMKCLGALDSFLMLVFLFESAIQGVAGAVIGIVLGVLLAIARGGFDFGGLIIDAMPWGPMLLIGVWSIVAGVLLAVLAAVGPAWMAARLAPMEAMRIE